MEEVAGLGEPEKRTELYTLMSKKILGQASTGRPVKQSPRMFVNMLAAIESFVVDESEQKYLRILGWWVLPRS